jgi:hypothetical protein
MPNLYLFIDGSPTPSGYTRVTTQNERYIRATKTPAEGATTGGSATHTHTTSGASVANNIITQPKKSEAYPTVDKSPLKIHNHSPGTFTVANANNDPSFYDLEMITIDMTTWETSYRTFPVGSILASAAAVNSPEVARFAAADSKYIRLGTAGTTGGNATHTHSATSTLASGNGSSSSTFHLGSGFNIYRNDAHTHTTSDTSSSTTSLPMSVATRLYQVASYVKYSTGGLIAFTDGTPSANWSIVDWDGCHLVSANSDATISGSNSSTHSLSGTSSSYTGVVLNTVSIGSSPVNTTSLNHTHTYSATLANADMSPLYLKLVPIVLNSTLYAATGGRGGQVVGLW